MATYSDLNEQLLVACQNGDFPQVKQLIEERHADPHCRDVDNSTPLHCASAEGHLQVVQYLIKLNCDINCRDVDDSTSLHLAAYCGHLDVCHQLVEGGADLLAGDKYGLTPVDDAQRKGHTHIASYLSSVGKTASSESDASYTILDLLPCPPPIVRGREKGSRAWLASFPGRLCPWPRVSGDL